MGRKTGISWATLGLQEGATANPIRAVNKETGDEGHGAAGGDEEPEGIPRESPARQSGGRIALAAEPAGVPPRTQGEQRIVRGRPGVAQYSPARPDGEDLGGSGRTDENGRSGEEEEEGSAPRARRADL